MHMHIYVHVFLPTTLPPTTYFSGKGATLYNAKPDIKKETTHRHFYP